MRAGNGFVGALTVFYAELVAEGPIERGFLSEGVFENPIFAARIGFVAFLVKILCIDDKIMDIRNHIIQILP